MFGFRDIDIIRSVARAGGFRAAADELGLAQSAISRRVRDLEHRMGQTLFAREGRGVRMTAVGRRFLEETEHLLAQRDRIAGEMSGATPTGTVRLGVAETMTHTLLPAMLTRLSDRFPQLRFELSVDLSRDMAEAISGDNLDVAIMLRDSLPPRAVGEPLPPLSLGWWAAPALIDSDRQIDVTTMAALPVISFPRGTRPHQDLTQRLISRSGPAPMIHCSASLSMTYHLAVSGFGVATMPDRLVKVLDTEGRMVRRLRVAPELVLPDLEFVVAYIPGRNRRIGQMVARAAVGE